MEILILTNGHIDDYEFYKKRLKGYDLIICADGGLNHAYKLRLLPQLAVGDFDSTSKEILKYYYTRGCKFLEHPARKDETDTEIAINHAIEQKPRKIDIFAGIGSRFDHSLANVQLLKKGLDAKIDMRIITEHNEIMLIDSRIDIGGELGDGVSLIPLTMEVSGVNTKGLEYPLQNAKLYFGQSYGISNYMIKDRASIEIEEGLLLVAKYND